MAYLCAAPSSNKFLKIKVALRPTEVSGIALTLKISSHESNGMNLGQDGAYKCPKRLSVVSLSKLLGNSNIS
jgi:hypothetical protein